MHWGAITRKYQNPSASTLPVVDHSNDNTFSQSNKSEDLIGRSNGAKNSSVDENDAPYGR